MATWNQFAVSRQGNDILILNLKERMTPDEAILLAAWLVVMAYDASESFESVRQKVEET